ncbi:MAG: PKD domain-containing protein, partial [Bacteroidia bacterium]|nr:PKD domain-containing protein [Bacteroidia bacterium]MDW8335265.1 PKD domain-containing protein [Bacteroidia bacterium]
EGLSAGTYSIVVRNADGCERRLEALLPAQTPQMRFSLNRETICAGDLVWVHVSGPEQVSWTAPDDGPALQTSDEGRLAGFRPQTTVVFTVTGHFGPQCALIETLTVNVLPKNELRAGFYPQNTIFERPPYAVEFVNVSDADVECEWDFGDQGVSTQFSPTRVYADTGRYEVRLRVRRPGTCDESVVRQTIHVRQADPSARPEFPGAFTLYPNPNDGRVHVFSPQALKAFVYDANGRKVFEAEVLGVEEWDWSSLAPGAYVCTFLRPDGTVFALKACKR